MILNNSKYDIEPNRDLVLRDEKVLPEVRNRPLLPRVFFSYSTFEILSESSRGTFRLIHSISDIPMRSSCSLKSFRGWRLVCFEPRLDTDFEMYGSSIGVRNILYFMPICLNRKCRNRCMYFALAK